MADYPNIRLRYRLVDVIGHGKYGVIYRAECRAEPQKQVAIKVLNNNYFDRTLIVDEIKILKVLDHPNIVKYHEELEDGPYTFIVTEFCSGGELFDRISGKEAFTESDAAAIVEKLLAAVNYCHTKNIAHRDIKPENIMYTSKDDHAEVKLIDFGLAKKGTYGKMYETMVGTPYYIAPEVIDGNYTNSCDVWSVGIVLHVMLSGFMPFAGANTDEIFRNIKAGQLKLEGFPVWDKVSPPAKDLLRKLLKTNEQERITAAEALKHTWFSLVKAYDPDINELDSTIMKSMKKYQGSSKFQKLCMNAFVKNLKHEEINHLVDVFHAFDKEKNGYIATKDLLQTFKNYYPAADLSDLVAQLDLEGHGAINYSQFIAATLNAKDFLTQERMWALYQYFNVGSNNALTVEDIQEVINRSSGMQYSIEEITVMLNEHKITKTDKIDFKKFSEIMEKLKFTPDEDVIQKVLI